MQVSHANPAPDPVPNLAPYTIPNLAPNPAQLSKVTNVQNPRRLELGRIYVFVKWYP